MTSSFYSALEADFRGSREEVKTRLKAYAPFWEPFFNVDLPCIAIDLGCGRGEWLELMQEVGIEASGVDLDAGMLAIAQELGLKVKAQDAIEALIALPSNSQSIVSGFHIAEHLPFEALQKLVQEALRVLRPGGLLILETPNPENIAVATNYFYIDPTHIRPLSPELMAFLPRHYGFHRSKIVRLQEDATLLSQPTLTVAQIIHGVSPDYALIAQKDGPSEQLLFWDSAFGRSYGITLGALSDRFYRLQLQKESNWQTQIELFQAQAELWHAQYLEVVRSSSWKITAPLRGIKNVFNAAKKWMQSLFSIEQLSFILSISNSAFIRRNVGRVARKFPFLYGPLVELARSFGVLPPAIKVATQDKLDDLESISQLTQHERAVLEQLEVAISQKRHLKQ